MELLIKGGHGPERFWGIKGLYFNTSSVKSYHLLLGHHPVSCHSCHFQVTKKLTERNCFTFPWLQITITIPPLSHPTPNHVFSRLSPNLLGYSFHKSCVNYAVLCFPLIFGEGIMSAPNFSGEYILHCTNTS